MFKIYNGYILRELAEAFFVAFFAYTFVLTLGLMLRPLQAGLGVMLVFKILPYGLPAILPWTVPVSVLTACVIAYGRLSSDNEILAMNAMGTNPFQVIAPALILAVVLAVPLSYCNHFVEPRSHQKRKAAMKEAAIKKPFSFLSLDKPVFSLSDVKIYIGEAEENHLSNVIIFHESDEIEKENEYGEFVPSSGEVRITYAKSATYQITGEGNNRELRLTLYDVELKYINRDDNFFYNIVSCDRVTERISLAEKAFTPGWKDMTTPELMKEIRKYTGPDAEPISERHLNKLLTRARMRWPSAFDAISLALLGAPLGMITKTGRKLVGFAVSVIVVVLVYFLILCGKAMSTNGVFPAPLWPWASVIVIAALGLILVRRQIKV